MQGLNFVLIFTQYVHPNVIHAVLCAVFLIIKLFRNSNDSQCKNDMNLFFLSKPKYRTVVTGVIIEE